MNLGYDLGDSYNEGMLIMLIVHSTIESYVMTMLLQIHVNTTTT